jgi:hypothetical protein
MGDKYRPQKGDRVRVVVEATVDWSHERSFATYDNVFNHDQGDVVSVEKIEDPLPTTPGSVVRQGSAIFALHGLVRYGKAHVAVKDCGYGPHLHAGFYGVPVDVEPS